MSNNEGRLGEIRHVNEVFVRIRGVRCYLWRAVDQDVGAIDIPVTKHRDRQAAKRFFRNALKHQGQAPWQLVTDKIRTYRAEHCKVFPLICQYSRQFFFLAAFDQE
jgi:putative transposase